jgi:hypothetical protein
MQKESKKIVIEEATSDDNAGDKKRAAMRIVDLKGEKVGDEDSSQALGENLLKEEDGENDPIESPEVLAYENPAPCCSFFNMVRTLMQFIMHSFFRDVQVLGKHNIPKRGPVIFCGNHQNQFVDGCVLYSVAQRDVRFMVAAKSMRRPLIGQLFQGGKAIPVERAQDKAILGKGKIRFDDAINVIGIESEFTKQFKVGDTVKILKGKDQVNVED